MTILKEKKVAFALITVVLLAALFIGRHCNLLKLDAINEFIVSYGIASPIIYILVMAIAIVISPIPSMPLAAVSGVIFGPFLGAIYSIIGGTIGAVISFYIARAFGRKFIERILKHRIDFCDLCTENYIVYFIFFSRMLPIFHFDIVSYGAGLTSITMRKFAVATFFGMAPMTFLFTYYGRVVLFGDSFIIAFSTLLILAIFIVPVLIEKYNIFGLKDRLMPR